MVSEILASSQDSGRKLECFGKCQLSKIMTNMTVSEKKTHHILMFNLSFSQEYLH